MKTHFEVGHIAKYDKILSRDTTSRQELKICYACERGFNKRKGRTKCEAVANRPGRYVCLRCVNDLMAGKKNNRTFVEFIDANPS